MVLLMMLVDDGIVGMKKGKDASIVLDKDSDVSSFS